MTSMKRLLQIKSRKLYGSETAKHYVKISLSRNKSNADYVGLAKLMETFTAFARFLCKLRVRFPRRLSLQRLVDACPVN